jgi:hypothetical protein
VDLHRGAGSAGPGEDVVDAPVDLLDCLQRRERNRRVKGDRCRITTAGYPCVNHDVQQGLQFGLAGCGVEVSDEQHRQRAVAARVGGQRGEGLALSLVVGGELRFPLGAADDHV